MFSTSDIDQIQQKGISPEQVNKQLEIFKKGISFLNVTQPATINNGIHQFNDAEIEELKNGYADNKTRHSISKFVPASGAATRMFKGLYEYLEDSSKVNSEADKFEKNIRAFAFYNSLKISIEKSGANINSLSLKNWIEFLLQPQGLNYGSLPKGLLQFHKYENKSRVPVEEHMVEGALYAQNNNQEVCLHFTISPEHMAQFHETIDSCMADYESEFGVRFTITSSIQKASTDTIAADNQNKPFRDKEGKLVFRPGGHGALLENLNDLQHDIIFIKNIDNVVPDRLKQPTTDYKLALAGFLLKIQQKVSGFLHLLDSQNAPRIEVLNEIEQFIVQNLGYRFAPGFELLSETEKSRKLYNILNRPIRVCGMVKNSGEPGGGPFWVKNNNGSESLQILESSQFNLDSDDQLTIFKQATHFNPVDLVVYTKNFKGQKFDLTKYSDPETCFISVKSKDGKELKALELPGLWNGAMANWNTAFVEVPVETFNPVKSVVDLLRNEHQA